MKAQILRRAGALLLALVLACSLLALPAAAENAAPDGESGSGSAAGSGGTPDASSPGGGDGEDVPGEPAIPSVTIKLNQEDGVSLPTDGTLTLRATVTAPEGVDTSLRWAPSENGRGKVKITYDPYRSETATVSLTASANPGDRFTVIATSVANPSAYALCAIEVTGPLPPEVSSVSITTSATYDGRNYIDPGVSNALALSAVVSPSGVLEEDARITWSSSDTSIAKVDVNTGLVTGISPGEAVITARAGDKFDERKVEVSGLLLSYVEKTSSGGKGETISLTEDDIVDIFQYRDITVLVKPFGNARNKNITWESSNNSVAQVLAGRVTAHYPGDNVIITATADGTTCQASFKVRVSEDVAQAINVDMGSEPSYSFSGLMSQLNSRCLDKTEDSLECVYSLKVSTKNGVLYYRFSSPDAPGHGVGGTERYYYQPTGQQMALRDVTFVPLPGFDGVAVVDYNAVSTNGTTFSGTIRIEAEATGDVTYSTALERPVDFAAEDFSAVCRGRTGRAIAYATFGLPSASRGTLYVNYSSAGLYSPKVDSNTRYYATSSPSIDSITFVPAEGFSGDVEIPYRCTDSSGASYSGTVTVRVYGADAGDGGDVEYSIGLNKRKTLAVSDFNDACQQATGRSLDYIRFTGLPSSRAGTLYLNYSSNSETEVSTSRDYFRTSSPRISSITFVPETDYSGTVTIPFTGTDTSGSTFHADLVIHVGGGGETVYYSAPKNQSVDFVSGDFNAVSRRVTGQTLDSVRFTRLPASSAGVLYYNYSGASGSRVSTDTDYWRSGSPSLSNITFVPAGGYAGTVSIPFTGYDEDGERFTGTVSIDVGGGGGRTISYSVSAGAFVRFSASDFASACRTATGDSLNYVRFELPASRYGTLYHQYSSSSGAGDRVSASTGYYYSGGSRRLGDVGFAAASSASGTVTFDYTGYSTGGDSFSGSVEVAISSASAVSSAIRYTGSSAAAIPFRAQDFQNLCQSALGRPLSYVQFRSLPAAGYLYLNYSGPVRTGSGVSTATRCGVQELGEISFVPKAESQGTVVIPFTAYDAQGGSCSGTVEIQLSNSYCYASFADTASGWDWAKPSIEFLRRSGIANGYSDNTYRPGQSISRGEFTLMICRAFQFSASGSSGFPDVPAGSTYAGAVAAARELGIVQGNNGLFYPRQPITRQSAMTMICRAIEAAGQSLPAADASILSSYADGYQVSAYARPSVAALVQMGAVRGNSASRLNPSAAISRAEMAVILHRVLTR